MYSTLCVERPASKRTGGRAFGRGKGLRLECSSLPTSSPYSLRDEQDEEEKEDEEGEEDETAILISLRLIPFFVSLPLLRLASYCEA